MVGVGGPKFLWGKQISSTNKRTMKLTDGRLQLIHDWLTKMKLLRLHGWERFGLRRIEAVRRQELACLWQYSLQWAWSTFFTQVQDSSFSFSSLVISTVVGPTSSARSMATPYVQLCQSLHSPKRT